MKKPCPTIPAACGTGILILTSSTGGGHDSVAVALQEAIQALAPEISVRVLDPLSGRGRTGPLSPARWYDATVAQAPWLWGLVYHATNRAWAVKLGLHGPGALLWTRRLRSILQSERPALVVSVHPLCTHLAAHVLRKSPVAPPLHCVVTDLVTIHRCWACATADAFYVATAEACEALIALGIPPGRIDVTGLPLRGAFAQVQHAAGSDAPPRVLLLGGGRPSRRLTAVARALAASVRPLKLVVVCGRNTRLRRRLARTVGTRATVLGWRDDIAALMQDSSVVVTKGGPTTVAEALSQARPLLIYQALPGQEAGNVALVERTGAGRYIPDTGALVCAVATRAQGEPTGNAAQALWWGSAAQRVAVRLVAAREDASTAPRRPAHEGGR